MDSKHVGIKQTHTDSGHVDYWRPVGSRVDLKNRGTYIANCNVENYMGFEDMCLIMYSDGQVGPYELGKASSREMIVVLKYAFGYY